MMTEASIPLEDMIERYGRVYTGAISDVLDEMNHYNQALPGELKPAQFGMRAVGTAFPVYGYGKRQADPDSIRPLLEILGEAPAGSVVIYETNGPHTGALVGEFAVNSLKMRGCRAAITDGGMRDTEYVLREDFPVWARYTTPANAVPRWQVVDWNCGVTIGDVRIEPGDIIVADLDGIVAVPRKLAAQVLLQCEELVLTEDKLREAVRSGMSPLEAYDQYG
jgi:regulator of RNase E activity RraA